MDRRDAVWDCIVESLVLAVAWPVMLPIVSIAITRSTPAPQPQPVVVPAPEAVVAVR
jgi:hypothetical protein